MYWIEKPPKATGWYRRRRAFLLIPKKIQGVWRWWESAEWEERVEYWHAVFEVWVPTRWMDKRELNLECDWDDTTGKFINKWEQCG